LPLGQHFDIGSVAGGEAEAEQLTPIIDHQVQLEAEKPAHARLAARRDPGKHLVLMDTPRVAHRKRGGVPETDAAASAKAGEQIGAQPLQHARHEWPEPPVADQVGKLGAQMPTHKLGVVGFEGALVTLLKVNADGHDLTRA
jgi:hypothetical protein